MVVYLHSTAEWSRWVTASSESVSWYMVVIVVVKALPRINLISAISGKPQLRRIVILHRDDGLFSS
jgi:hypothetical protein